MRFEGSIVALVTPWRDDGQLDASALAALIDWHVAAGTDALVIAGSTGESVSLEDAEWQTLVATAVDAAAGRITLLAGTGTPSTARSVRLTQRALALGVAGALVVTPAYVRPTQEGLRRHYLAIADVGMPLLLYNVPGRTAVDLLPETVAQLCGHPLIVGIKEALADPARWQALLALRGTAFSVLSGDDPTALDCLRLGYDGVISVAANAVPAQFAALVAAARAGDWSRAAQLDAGLRPLYDALACEPNPIPIKYALAHAGRCGPGLRLPLTPLSACHEAPLAAALAQAAALR